MLIPEDDQIGQDVEQLRDGDVHTIAGRAVHLVDALPHLFHTQRTTERERVTDGARFGVRRNDGHIADGAQGLGEHVQPVGAHAVIVGDENLRHVRRGSITGRSRRARAPRR